MSKKTFTSLTADVENIQKLDDLPNAVNGLSADELKAEFDKAGKDIKTYINSTLLDELAKETVGSSGAARIGIEPVVALSGIDNVMDAITGTIALITSGTIPDGGVTTVKLDTKAVTTAKIDDGAVTDTQCDFSGGLDVDGTLNVDGTVSLNDAVTFNDVIVLTSDMYGTTLPVSPVTGQLFFKKV